MGRQRLQANSYNQIIAQWGRAALAAFSRVQFMGERTGLTVGQETALVLWAAHGWFVLSIWCSIRFHSLFGAEAVTLNRTMALAVGTAATLVSLVSVVVPPSLGLDGDSRPSAGTTETGTIP
jgi:hypothetical protein